jgi:hypothetical protein
MKRNTLIGELSAEYLGDQSGARLRPAVSLERAFTNSSSRKFLPTEHPVGRVETETPAAVTDAE